MKRCKGFVCTGVLLWNLPLRGALNLSPKYLKKVLQSHGESIQEETRNSLLLKLLLLEDTKIIWLLSGSMLRVGVSQKFSLIVGRFLIRSSPLFSYPCNYYGRILAWQGRVLLTTSLLRSPQPRLGKWKNKLILKNPHCIVPKSDVLSPANLNNYTQDGGRGEE